VEVVRVVGDCPQFFKNVNYEVTVYLVASPTYSTYGDFRKGDITKTSSFKIVLLYVKI